MSADAGIPASEKPDPRDAKIVSLRKALAAQRDHIKQLGDALTETLAVAIRNEDGEFTDRARFALAGLRASFEPDRRDAHIAVLREALEMFPYSHRARAALALTDPRARHGE